MTDVRLTANGVTKSLGDVPFGALESVIPFIQSWGLKVNYNFADTDQLCGQFVLEHDAYFEVLLDD